MTTIELREKFQENTEVIKKLKNMLKDKNNTVSTSLIKDSIDKVNEEQREITGKLRKSIYSNLSKKNISKLMNSDRDKTEVLTSTMKKEQFEEKREVVNSDDKTEVLTSFMKEDTVEANDKTEVLTSVKKEELKEEKVEVVSTEAMKRDMFKTARIVFDGSYKLYYDNDKNVEIFNFDNAMVNMLKHNDDIDGIYDFNIITILKDFDNKNNTKLYDRYMQNKLPVSYFYNRKSIKKTNKSIIKRLKNITDRQKAEKDFSNVVVYDSIKNVKKAVAISVGAAALVLLGSLGIKLNRRSISDANANTSIIREVEEDNAGVTDADYESVTIGDDTMINDSVQDIVLEDKNDSTEVVKIEVEETTETPEIVETETRVGDIVQFTDNVDLYYASTDENPRGNTSYIQEKKFEVGLISVVYKGRVVAYVDNSDISLEELEDECKKKYGDDVEVSLNVKSLNNSDEVVNEYLGWIDEEQYQEYGKVLVK